MTPEDRLVGFLNGYHQLARKYQLGITGCNCCNTWVWDTHPNAGNAFDDWNLEDTILDMLHLNTIDFSNEEIRARGSEKQQLDRVKKRLRLLWKKI
jgi:hypothetical protein